MHLFLSSNLFLIDNRCFHELTSRWIVLYTVNDLRVLSSF